MKHFQWCIVLFATLDVILAARILAVLPYPTKSHHNLFQAILRNLAENGHEVVSYTPYPLAQPVANYTNIELQIKSVDDKLSWETIYAAMTWPPHTVTSHMAELCVKLMENVFENDKILELIKSQDKFDLVIVEAFYYQEAFLGFGHKFNAPVVNIHPFGPHTIASLAAGNPLNLADVPDFPLPYSNEMTFLQRAYNMFTKLFPLYTYYTKSLPNQQQVMSKAFNDSTMPPIEELISKISLYLNNGHPYVDYPQPYTPNIVPLGGIHLASERKPISPEIQRFLDEAPHGVVYFSLGSVIPDQVLGEQFFLNFISVFRTLPQRVLWKTNSKFLHLPANVMTANWLPQQDVLAHPKVVAFMTHGGLFSLYEAVHAGVPVVCIPFFIDQPRNAKFYEAKEVGVRLLFHTLSEETISSALHTVLNNTKYNENMMKLSLIFRNYQLSPKDRLVYWVNYVLKHNGAHHLTPVSARLPLYQLWLLDVVAALLVASGVTAIVGYLLVINMIVFYKGHINPVLDRVKKTK